MGNDLETLENDLVETSDQMESESTDILGDIPDSQEDPVESTEDIMGTDPVVLPDDYLDVQTFQEGVETILTALEPTEEIGDYVGEMFAAIADPLSLILPDNYNVFYLGDKQLAFPSDTADDLLLVDGYLVNVGNAITINVDLSDSSSVSNYVISQVTFPTFNSSDYFTYVSNYGEPYRIVDRYYENSYLRSYTRTSSAAITAETISRPDWAGFSGDRMYGFIFAIVVIILLLWGRLRWKLT